MVVVVIVVVIQYYNLFRMGQYKSCLSGKKTDWSRTIVAHNLQATQFSVVRLLIFLELTSLSNRQSMRMWFPPHYACTFTEDDNFFLIKSHSNRLVAFGMNCS